MHTLFSAKVTIGPGIVGLFDTSSEKGGLPFSSLSDLRDGASSNHGEVAMKKSKTRTGHVAVNAAFLKDIKDDNRELKALMDKIQPLASQLPTAVNHWPELIRLFADLRDQLAMHFSLEEAFGYFEDAIITAPQLSVTAERLRGEHAVLFQQIRDLADLAFEVPAEADEQISMLLKRFDDFQSKFQRHEEAELTLILDAMGDDIGVGD